MNRNQDQNQQQGQTGVSRRSDSMSRGGLFPAFDHFFNDFFDMDRFFPSNLMPAMQPMMQQFRQQQPAVNIIENDNEFRIEVSAPGMKKEDFHVDMEEGRLTISAEHKYERQEGNASEEGKGKGKDKAGPQQGAQNERYTRREFGFSQFSRSFMLPESIDPENIQANYQDGILRLTLPKREEERQRKQRRQINIS